MLSNSRNWHLFTLGILFCLAPRVLPQNKTPVEPNQVQQKARAFIERLAKGAYAEATQDYDAVMQKALPADKLEQTWKFQLASVGAFRKQGSIRTQHIKKYEAVIVTCQFEHTTRDIRVVFNSEGQISGLFFHATYSPPDYVQQSRFQERSVTIGSAPWQLPGTLTIPVSGGPFPALVLVHGSGPNDRDETIGPNMPFRDLAWGLATQGIAVLRYEKRTKAHGAAIAADLANLTIKEETIDDALAAVDLLEKTEGIAPRRVIVLGHSLGGQCAPQIAAMNRRIAGVICLAGNTRPIEDVLREQFDYVLSLGNQGEEQRKELEDLRQKVNDLKQLDQASVVPSSKMLLGGSARYWKSVRDCKAGEIASRLAQPMLILQGERDYQVTMVDFQGWKTALAGRTNVTFKSYPKLNHLFMEGQGKAKPAEYSEVGHVSREVIDDIVRWIKAQKPAS